MRTEIGPRHTRKHPAFFLHLEPGCSPAACTAGFCSLVYAYRAQSLINHRRRAWHQIRHHSPRVGFLRIFRSLRKFGWAVRGSFDAFLDSESLERVVEEILWVAKPDGSEGMVLVAVYIGER